MVISKAAIRRPVTVVMAFIGVAMIGAFSAFRLPIEQFPQIEIPYVGVSIPYSGTSAQEIERNVTRPVEEILSTMTGVDRMFSFTRPGQVFFNLSLHPMRTSTVRVSKPRTWLKASGIGCRTMFAEFSFDNRTPMTSR